MLSRRQFLEKLIIGTVACGLGGVWTKEINAANASPIPVLAYHRVGATTDPLTVSTEKFCRDLEALKKHGYSTISLLDLKNSIYGQGHIKLPAKPVLITFDDGYLDNYENAFASLCKMNMVATFYVITGMFGYENRLSESHIKEMQKAGMDFGSHTVSHQPLGKLQEETARSELYYSKRHLESILGTEVSSIAYPRGSYNEDTIRIANELNYAVAFTVNQGICSNSSAKLLLPRIPVFRYTYDVISEINKQSA